MTLDTTVGTSTSQSYASVAEADAYLAFRGDTSTWTALTVAQKEQKLQWAAVQLDTLYFRGNKLTYSQALEWPRNGVVNKNGWYEQGIPQPLKNAQAELAFQLIANDWTQGLGPITQDSMKVGSIEMGRKSHRPFPAAVAALLRPFLAAMPNSGGRLVRG